MTSSSFHGTVTDQGGSAPWSNLSNLASSNNAYATATTSSPSGIRPNGLKFDTFGISLDGILIGIEVSLEGKLSSTAGSGNVITVALSESGITRGSTNVTFNTVDQVYKAGGPADLWSWISGISGLANLRVDLSVSGASSGKTYSLDEVYVTIYYIAPIPLEGDQPSATGTIVAKRFAALAGAQPAAAGALVAKWANKFVQGNQAAPSGGLVAKWANKFVQGNQAAPSGGLFVGQTALLEGNQGAPAGAVVPLFQLKLLSGDQAAPAGALARYLTVAKMLAGDQPAAAGLVAADFIRNPVLLPGGRATVSSVRLGAGRARAVRPGY